MILVDTSIIVEYWKNPKREYTDVFITQDIAICGIVQAELIYGARSNKEVEKIISALECFNFIDIDKEDWNGIGKFLHKLRIKGVKIPFQDAIIAYLAVKNNIPLWTRDKHFELIRDVIKELKVYKPI
ncbi:MAG TPA: PIN domain-containing protein [Spirochaetota bacterium]|nr:PIN domain-containing protein [Spirochaetota bacterium]